MQENCIFAISKEVLWLPLNPGILCLLSMELIDPPHFSLLVIFRYYYRPHPKDGGRYCFQFVSPHLDGGVGGGTPDTALDGGGGPDPALEGGVPQPWTGEGTPSPGGYPKLG